MIAVRQNAHVPIPEPIKAPDTRVVAGHSEQLADLVKAAATQQPRPPAPAPQPILRPAHQYD